MPDAQGNFKSAFYALSEERWRLIFGKKPRTFLAGAVEAAHSWCFANGVSWGEVATSRHPTVRYLGLEPDRMCGIRVRPEDTVVRVSPLPPDAEKELQMREILGRR